MKIKYNHNRELDSFTEQIEIIKNAGFKPIGVSQMYFEDTFIFETNKEAKEAYNKLELNNLVSGYWYGKDDFNKEVLDYENNDGYSKVKIYWL